MKIQILQDIIDIIRGKKKIKSILKRKKKVTIPFLVFWVGTKCTLRCKLCCNLIPYLKQESSDLDSILSDLKFICKNADIDYLQIQGGEPFTHPNIDKIVDCIGKIKNIKYIEIATNGTVINLNNDTLKVLKDNKNIVVRVSNYDCTKNIRDKFINKLKSYNINVRTYDFGYGDGSWFSTGGVDEVCEINDNKVQATYNICDEKSCVTYYDGKIYACGKIFAIRYWYNIDENKINDFDEIPVSDFKRNNNSKDFIQRLRDFYINYDRFKEECRYCKIDNSKRYQSGEQLTVIEYNEILKRQEEKDKKRDIWGVKEC